MGSGISVVDLEVDSEMDLKEKEKETELIWHYINKHTKLKTNYPWDSILIIHENFHLTFEKISIKTSMYWNPLFFLHNQYFKD